METRCQKCGTPAAGDQAFCGRCGAVLGMVDDAGGGAAPDLAATMVGKKLPTTPAPRPSTRPPSANRPAAPPPSPPAHAAGSNTLILVAVGFVVVLLVGTLILLYFLLGRG